MRVEQGENAGFFDFLEGSQSLFQAPASLAGFAKASGHAPWQQSSVVLPSHVLKDSQRAVLLETLESN